jgi:D-aspartate ligase
VLKPSIRKPEWDRNSKQKAFTPADAGELLALYDRTAGWADVLVAQEWIRGTIPDHYTCNCYLDAESRPLVTFVTRKIRQWPPQTGIGSLGEEARNDTVLRETLRLFQGAGFHGLAYLEMKRDPQTGEHYIIEPNIGRPTGRSATAEAGGVELLYTMYCDAAGLPLPPDRTQRYLGVKWIYARTDLQSALHQWRRGELSLGDWRRSLRGPKVDAVFSLRDPAPFVFDLLRAARLLAGRDGRRAVG